MEKNRFPLIMKSIAVITTLCTFLLIMLYLYLQQDWMLTCSISLGATAYHFVMRLSVGYIVPKITGYRFDYRNAWFQPRSWEPAFYQKLNIRAWKGTLPTYSPAQFSLKSNTLQQIIQNMCGAEIVHEIIMVLSFLPLLTVPFFGAFFVFFTTSVLAALYDSIFVMAQRYNRPRLVRLYEKQEAKHS